MENNTENKALVSPNDGVGKRISVPTDIQTESFTFNIADAWDVLVKRLWIMILVGALVGFGIYYREKKSYTPVYTSTATLYMLFEDRVSENASYAYNFAKALIGDIQYCIITSATAKEAYSRLKDDGIEYWEISGAVSTENPENTRYVLVTARAYSPEKAKLIVNTICDVCKEKMREDTGDEVVNISAAGEENPSPINSVTVNNGLKYGLISVAVVYGIFLIIRMFDDRFRDEYDMEKTLNITLLGSIPDASSVSSSKLRRRRKKYKYSYGKYGYGYGYGYTYGYGYGTAYGGVKEKTDSPEKSSSLSALKNKIVKTDLNNKISDSSASKRNKNEKAEDKNNNNNNNDKKGKRVK